MRTVRWRCSSTWLTIPSETCLGASMQSRQGDMSRRCFVLALNSCGHLCLPQLDEGQREKILQQVHQFWAKPNHDLSAPPPHSTGSAVDLTLMDVTTEEELDMVRPIRSWQ